MSSSTTEPSAADEAAAAASTPLSAAAAVESPSAVAAPAPSQAPPPAPASSTSTTPTSTSSSATTTEPPPPQQAAPAPETTTTESPPPPQQQAPPPLATSTATTTTTTPETTTTESPQQQQQQAPPPQATSTATTTTTSPSAAAPLRPIDGGAGPCGAPLAWRRARDTVLHPLHRRMPGCGGATLGELAVMGALAAATAVVLAGAWGSDEGSGSAATLPLVLAMALAARNSVFFFVLGIPFERALEWHKAVAMLAIAAAVLHGVWAGANGSGVVLAVAYGVLLVGSLAPVRRRAYELFLRVHWLAVVVMVLGAMAHEAGGVAFGVILVLVDVTIRVVAVARRNPRRVQAVVLPANVLRLQFAPGTLRFAAGQYVFVCVPALSHFEWHPFSLSCSPDEARRSGASVHVRVLGAWTQRLYDHVRALQGAPLRVWVEGPYGAPSVRLDRPSLQHVMFLSGGIGITPMQSLCNALLEHAEHVMRRIHFVWVVRDRYTIDAVRPFDTAYAEVALPQRLPRSFQPDLLTRLGRSKVTDGAAGGAGDAAAADVKGGGGDGGAKDAGDDGAATGGGGGGGGGDDVLRTDFYLTKAPDDAAARAAAGIRDDAPHLRFGRPDVAALVRALAAEAQRDGAREAAVFVCGPAAIVREARRAATGACCAGFVVHVHTESFLF